MQRNYLGIVPNFLASPITQTVYVLHDKLESLSNSRTFYSKLETLTLSFNSDVVKKKDEVATLAVVFGSFSLIELFNQNKVESLSEMYLLCESSQLLIPQNMLVEPWFSEMKTAESLQQSHFSPETYNDVRLARSFFSRSSLEDTEFLAELLFMSKAAESYVKKVKAASEASRIQHEIAASAREHLGVFKSHTPSGLKKKITDTDELEKALGRKAPEKKKAKVEPEKTGVVEHADAMSASVQKLKVLNSHLFLFFLRERL